MKPFESIIGSTGGRRWLALALASALAASGCGGPPSPAPGVPGGATLITQVKLAGGERPAGVTPLEADTDGTVYVYNASTRTLVFKTIVPAGNVLQLSPAGLSLANPHGGRSKRTLIERSLVRYSVGQTYQVYFRPGVDADLAHPQPASRPTRSRPPIRPDRPFPPPDTPPPPPRGNEPPQLPPEGSPEPQLPPAQPPGPQLPPPSDS